MEQQTSDLEIELSARSTDSYSIALRFIAAGSDSEQRLLKADATTIEQSRFAPLKDLSPGSDAYAKTLSEAFFSNPLVAVAFEKAVSSSQALNSLLRIRLLLDPSRPELHDIQWECLRDVNGNPIATDHRNLFSRYLPSLDWQPPRLSSTTKIKTLVAVANPSNLADFSLAPIHPKAELEHIKEALPDDGIDILENPTLTALTSKLTEGFDVVYLICHGALVDSTPMLMLCDEEGKVALAPGSALAGHIKDLAIAPRLIVLASCQSAQGLGSLAPMLAQAGVPAIIAMNGNFSMEANAIFMPKFFQALAEEGLIDKAMSIARGALRGDADAWMPILYMRLRTGQLLQTTPPPTPAPAPAPAPQIIYMMEPPKPKRKLFWWLAIPGAFILLTVFLYNLGSTDETQHLDFFLERTTSEKLAADSPSEILASEALFSKSDLIAIQVVIPKQGHFYAFDRYDDGKFEIIYPPNGADSTVTADQKLRLPTKKNFWISTASSTITLVWTQDARFDLEEAIKASDRDADGTRIITQPAPSQALESRLADLTSTTRREVVTTPTPLSKLSANDFHVAYSFRLDFQ